MVGGGGGEADGASNCLRRIFISQLHFYSRITRITLISGLSGTDGDTVEAVEAQTAAAFLMEIFFLSFKVRTTK